MTIQSDIYTSTVEGSNANVIIAEYFDGNSSSISLAVDYTDLVVRIANAAERILDNVYRSRVLMEQMVANVEMIKSNVSSINTSISSIKTDINKFRKDFALVTAAATTETLGLVSRGICSDYACAETQALFNMSIDDIRDKYNAYLKAANTTFSYSSAITSAKDSIT